MEIDENKNIEKEVDSIVNNYLDDIFSSTTKKINDPSKENLELEDLNKNLTDNNFKTQLDELKTKKKEKSNKKKKKNKKFRLKTLTIDARIDVIDEEDSDEVPEDKIQIKKEEKVNKKVKKHYKSNSMDIISENIVKKFSNNKKNIKKIQLIRPPPSNEINDDFYLNKFINKSNHKNNDELCIFF